jgi:hypothetical protein
MKKKCLFLNKKQGKELRRYERMNDPYHNQLNYGQQPGGQAMFMQAGGGLNQTMAIPGGSGPQLPPGLPPNAS